MHGHVSICLNVFPCTLRGHLGVVAPPMRPCGQGVVCHQTHPQTQHAQQITPQQKPCLEALCMEVMQTALTPSHHRCMLACCTFVPQPLVEMELGEYDNAKLAAHAYDRLVLGTDPSGQPNFPPASYNLIEVAQAVIASHAGHIIKRGVQPFGRHTLESAVTTAIGHKVTERVLRGTVGLMMRGQGGINPGHYLLQSVPLATLGSRSWSHLRAAVCGPRMQAGPCWQPLHGKRETHS